MVDLLITDHRTMTRTITADLIAAYSHCPRKAFLLMAGEPTPVGHDYFLMTLAQAADNRQVHRNGLAGNINIFHHRSHAPASNPWARMARSYHVITEPEAGLGGHKILGHEPIIWDE